jgi:hypothetical protein
MRFLITIHRWWGVTFCLLFAMWFASGIVIHFVPFPARREQPVPLGMDLSRATIDQVNYDQWSVAGVFNVDRPLKRITLNDVVGTEIYISAASGNVVLTTTRNERLLNYPGSIAHWLYPTELRHHAKAWSSMMWWLSLLATIGAALGVFLGLVRLFTGPVYRGLQRWHHICGLIAAPFLLCWIFSGFLSMNDGLFAGSDQVFLAMHKLDFEPLASHPVMRTSAIVVLCLFGFAFSLTGAVLAWRRVTSKIV